MAGGAAGLLATRNAGAWDIYDPAFPPDGLIPYPQDAKADPSPPRPQSFIGDRTLITVYGRSFGVAPVLGMLGAVQSLDEMAQRVQPWADSVGQLNDNRPVTLAPHLLYAVARPCYSDDDSCVILLDASGVDIIGDYIEPARERGMAVVLDAQMGRLSPLYFIRRMIDAGFLAYPNVHVALDPEFATRPGQTMPGDPIGHLTADAINRAQELLATYVRDENLPFKKLLMVHQFADLATTGWTMISHKHDLEVFPEVELVIDADGFGSPDVKVWAYNELTSQERYPRIQWRGLKLFQANPYAPRFSDRPMLTPQQVFGLDPTPGGHRMWAAPHVLVIA